MIRYDIALVHLEKLVDAAAKTWRTRAAKRKAQLAKLKKYAEGGPDWSEVKAIYMREQGDSKCIYCERKLEAVEIGLIEQDVEHFRPKSSVSAWTPPAHLQKHNIPITAPPGTSGYYLLPHELYNYAASCKPCNSVCKGDRFPISGTYDLKGGDPIALRNAELPLLIYPLGNWDDDPEDLIGFNGISPFAKKTAGHQMHRALVTIAFFKLDDVEQRSNLFLERAQGIIALYQRLKDTDDQTLTAQERQDAKDDVALSISPKMPHANCMRNFVAVYKSDPARAKQIYEDARAYRRSKS
jgi:hypothetical protein